jgi:hypothetical protein
MPVDPVACPYCNTFVTVAPGAVAGQIVPCPRCGEAFTYRRPEGAGPTEVQTTPNPGATPPVVETSPAVRYFLARRANRLVAACVLGVMFLMATVGLTYALWTQKDRRAHDTDLGKRPRRFPASVEDPLPEVATVAPARLAALGYLPPDSNVVAGVHVAELMHTAAGRELLTKPLKVGSLEIRFDSLERLSVLKLDELDHVVLGLRAEDPLGQPAALVVRTRRPYDAERVKAALKTERLATGGEKTLDRFEIKDTPFRPVLWCADDHTLVFALLPAHFEQIAPRKNIDHLPRAVQKVLEERVGGVGPLWLAGHVADWNKAEWPNLLPRLKKEDLERWSAVRTFAVWLQCEEGVQVSAAIQCRDADAAHALEAFFTGGDKWKSAREEDWLSLQWKTDLDGLRQGLAR